MSRKTMFKKTVVAQALAVTFTLLGASAIMQSTAYAQSNTVGSIFGQAAAGSTVLIENMGTGAKRTVTPDASGRFTATSLQPGQYKVNQLKGTEVTSTRQVDVLIGQGSEVKFIDTTLAGVQVVGRRQAIDVSSSNNGTNFTAKQLDALPIAKDLGAIIQLAPNTTRGDYRYNGAASMGGAAPSENAFYINGFPATNPLNQLGSSTLPFGAIAQAQVLTGGFGAEFGRSTGGVVNVTTKSGTNQWEAGVNYSITPNSLRAKSVDIYYTNTGDPANTSTDGTLNRRRSENTLDESTLGAYIGGPLIKDRLFMFLAVESLASNSGLVQLPTSSILTGDVDKWGWSDRRDVSNRYMGKFDWNLTDNNRLELTLIGDKSTRNEKLSGYNYATSARNGKTGFTADYTNVSGSTPVGMDDQILKYTANLTDDLTVTALYGKAQSPHINTFLSSAGAGGSLYTVVLVTPTAAAPGVTYNNPQANSSNQLPDGAQDNVTSTRADLEWRLGQHTLRAGLDNNKLSSTNAGDFFPGGGTYSYRYTSKPLTLKPCGGCAPVATGGGLGTAGYYARERIFTDVTDAFSDQQAQYVEDRWQLTKNVLLSFGLRNESFQNKNPAGEIFLEQNNTLSPRFGAAWDVKGDSSLKVFGSAGRYSVQIPTHLAVRGAGPSTYLQQFFTYTGVGPDGAPIGRSNIGPQYSPDGEIGTPKDAKVLASTNLKPNQQDEITLGFEKAFSPELNFGAKVTYRKMVATIDDWCDQAPIDAYAAAHGIDATNYGGFNCASINPGVDNTLLVDYAGTKSNYTTVKLSALDMGFDTAQRTYVSVDLFAEHPLKNGWYGKINYSWSKSEGNTEGQTLSDIGQTDVSATQAWDFAQLMEYSYGRLPNDRTHQIKAYGFYELSNELMVGGNLLWASGRPRSCIGSYAGTNPNGDPGYGSATHYCNGVPSPRGSLGQLPNDTRLDMNFVYKPNTVKGLALKVDIFNVFNQQLAQAVDEVYNTGGPGTPVSSTYERVLSYTPARAIKLSMSYDYKF